MKQLVNYEVIMKLYNVYFGGWGDGDDDNWHENEVQSSKFIAQLKKIQ